MSGERARARLAAIVQDSQDAIIAIDARRRVTGWNPGAERLLGYTAEEMVGRPIRDIVPAAEARLHEAFTGRVLKHGEAAQFEGTRVRRDGTTVPIALSVSPIRGATGTVIGVSAIMRDISERKREEARRAELLAQLAEAQERFRSAFEQAPTGVVLISVRPGDASAGCSRRTRRCTRCSAATPASSPALTYLDVIHPDDRDQYAAPLQAVMAGEARELRHEIRFLRADGSEITVAVRATPVRDRDGEPLYLVCHLQDVTEERRQEAQLRHLANHDPLTGLVNRRRFEEEVDRAVAEGRRYEPAGALLVSISTTSSTSTTPTATPPATAARRRRAGDARAAARVGHHRPARRRRVRRDPPARERRGGAQHRRRPARRRSGTTPAWTSTGARSGSAPPSACARSPATGSRAEQLLAEADVAMYDAKEAGRDRATLAARRGATAWRGCASASAGASASATRWTRTGSCSGSSRSWICAPARGRGRSCCCACAIGGELVAPGEFLDVAERFGLIQAIDRWVVAQAIALLAARRAAGEQPTVEVNLSGASITDEEVMEHITAEMTSAPGSTRPASCSRSPRRRRSQHGAGAALRPAPVGSRVPVRPGRLRRRLRLVLLPQAPAVRRDQDRRRLHPRAARARAPTRRRCGRSSTSRARWASRRSPRRPATRRRSSASASWAWTSPRATTSPARSPRARR